MRAYRDELEAGKRKDVNVRNFHLLENKVARLENIVEILKSATCTPKSPLKQRLYAAEQLYGKYNVHVICDAFDIPRGTFYNHVLRNKKNNTWYAKRREKLRLRIQEIYDESNQIFGAAKITAVLKSEGFKVSNEMVRTLMRDMGLKDFLDAVEKKVERLNSDNANYAPMKHYELFVNSAILIPRWYSSQTVERLKNINQGARRFDNIYLIVNEQKLLIFDMLDNTVQEKCLYMNLERMAQKAAELYEGADDVQA